MAGLFSGHVFQGMGLDDEATAPSPDDVAKANEGRAKGGTFTDLRAQAPLSLPQAPTQSASSTPWLPYALIGGGVLVAAGLIWAATSGGVKANGRRYKNKAQRRRMTTKRKRRTRRSGAYFNLMMSQRGDANSY